MRHRVLFCMILATSYRRGGVGSGAEEGWGAWLAGGGRSVRCNCSGVSLCIDMRVGENCAGVAARMVSGCCTLVGDDSATYILSTKSYHIFFFSYGRCIRNGVLDEEQNISPI